MTIATVTAERTVESLEEFQAELHTIAADRVTGIVSRIVDGERQGPVLDVAAFSSAM